MPSPAHYLAFLDSPKRSKYRRIMAAPSQPPDGHQNGLSTAPFSRTRDELTHLQEIEAAHQQHYRQYETQELGRNIGNDVPITTVYDIPPVLSSTEINSFFTLINSTNPFYNLQPYPVQPYGFGQMKWQPENVIHAPGGNIGFIVPSHMTSGTEHAGAIYPLQPPLSCLAGPWLSLNGGTQGSHDNSRSKEEQAQDIRHAHHRLNAVVGSGHAPDSPHEPSSSPLSSVPAWSVTGDYGDAEPGITASGPMIDKITIVSHETTYEAPASEQGLVHDVQIELPPVKRKRGRPKGSRKTKSARVEISSEPDTAEARQQFIGSSMLGSDVDAEGEYDYYYDGKTHTVRNSNPEETSREQRLKADARKTSNTELKEQFSAVSLNGKVLVSNEARRRNPRTKKRKRGSAISDLHANEHIVAIPDELKDKEQPQHVDDLLRLIAFETTSYNTHPQRQLEVQAINYKIKRENITRGVRNSALQRRLARQSDIAPAADSPARPTRSGDSVQKRKAEDVPQDHISASQPKSRKTVRAADQPVASLLMIIPGRAGDQQAATDDRDTKEADGDFQDEPGEVSAAVVHREAFADSELPDFDADANLPPLRPLRPKPGSFVIDEFDNALPNPSHRRGSRQTENPDVECEAEHTWTEQPKLEKVRFVPKDLRYLVKRVEKVGVVREMFEAQQDGGEMIAGHTDDVEVDSSRDAEDETD